MTGITPFARGVFYVFVLAPKALLALWLGLAGSGLVLRSESNYDLVLNAVAAGFVLDLDEVAHRVFLPRMKKNMAKCPPLGVTQAEIMHRFDRCPPSPSHVCHAPCTPGSLRILISVQM